ncbi:MAG: ribosome silencing factor [Candidatus Omnitrophica bacterium]|nr:ribosome silencing factor [Candidatus Omnitrophota bacterium]MCM8771219.1 ribosome silencing factor [Candidatus Omnitrophota bacterium]
MLKVTNFCDYFVILSASSLRKAAAIAEAIEEELAKEKINSRSAPVAVQKESGWILLDFSSVIVHIFYKPLREFYCLEHLWQDAPRLRFRLPPR